MPEELHELARKLIEYHGPEGLRFDKTASGSDVAELVGRRVLYDIRYRGVFLWFVSIESHDIYRMRLRLVAPSQTVLLQDERDTYLKTPSKLKRDVFRGVYTFLKEADSAWGRREDGSLGSLYAYRFDIEATKAPIREIIEQAGWKLEERKFDAAS